MSTYEATSRQWSAGYTVLFGFLAVWFCVGALSQPPQLGFLSVYCAFVAALFVLCGAAVWRASSSSHAGLASPVVRRVSMVQWFMTMLVWANPAALYGYACVAFIEYGNWPSYAHPDPKDLQLPLLHGLVFLSHYMSALGVVAWLGCFPLACRALGPRQLRSHTLTFALGVAAIYLIFFQNLGGVSEWYAD